MKHLKYTLGLDLGIASIGWSIVEISESEDSYVPKRLIRAGVRAFSAAENPKNGESLNIGRREARSTRRRLHRRKVRLNSIKQVLKETGFISDIHDINYVKEVFELRVKGLDSRLEREELVSVVLYLAKHRGFKSNRKKDPQDGGGKFGDPIRSNKSLMDQKGYRTFGEMLLKDDQFKYQKRNKGDSYLVMIDRESLRTELEIILKKQQEYYPELTDDTVAMILEVSQKQLPFVREDMIAEMVGFCKLEPEEKRAPQNAYSFELFRALQSLSNLRIKNLSTYEERGITEEERDLLMQKMSASKVNYSKVRTLLKLTNEEFFTNLGSRHLNDRDEIESKKSLFEFKGYFAIRKALKLMPEWDHIKDDYELLDKIAWVLSVYKSDEDIEKNLKNLDLSDAVIECLLGIVSFSKFGHISLKAIYKILPYMKAGSSFTDACTKAGYEPGLFSNQHTKLPLIDTDEIRNPVVIRSLTQARKVVNAVIDRYGSPSYIHIEVSRDLGKSKKLRDETHKGHEQNHKNNSALTELLRSEFGLQNPSDEDSFKLKLWREQGGKCAYSQKRIDATLLFSDYNYTQIDHVVPWSRSLDNSYFNKVLVLTSENQNKRNMTPYEFMDGANNSEKWQNYCAFVKSLNIPLRKISRLLTKEDFPQLTAKNFLERDLNDTRYISRYFKNFVEENLLFADSNSSKRKVFVFTGQFTHMMRKFWLSRFNKDRKNNRHHALDATVVACSSFGQIQKVTKYVQDKYVNNKIFVPRPWEDFEEDLECRIFEDDPLGFMKSEFLKSLYADMLDNIKPILVSRPPMRKLSGPAHKETVYSPKLFEEGFIIERKDVKTLKNDDLDKIYGDDQNVMSVLRKYIEDFPEPKKRTTYPRKFAKSGLGPEIKKVKIKEASNLGVYLNNKKGVASNGSMVRVDIFTKDGKNYLVPVYVADLAGKKELPMLTTGAKGKKKMLDESYEFKFSLYPDDYFEVKTKDRSIEGYYVKTDSNGGSLYCIPHDSVERTELPKIGVSIAELKKCIISLLGEKSYIASERRVSKG